MGTGITMDIEDVISAIRKIEAGQRLAQPPLRIFVTGSMTNMTKEQWHTVRLLLYGAKIGRDEAWVGCFDHKGAEEQAMKIAVALGYYLAGFRDDDGAQYADIVYSERPNQPPREWCDHEIIISDVNAYHETPATIVRSDGTMEHLT